MVAVAYDLTGCCAGTAPDSGEDVLELCECVGALAVVEASTVLGVLEMALVMSRSEGVCECAFVGGRVRVRGFSNKVVEGARRGWVGVGRRKSRHGESRGGVVLSARRESGEGGRWQTVKSSAVEMLEVEGRTGRQVVRVRTRASTAVGAALVSGDEPAGSTKSAQEARNGMESDICRRATRYTRGKTRWGRLGMWCRKRGRTLEGAE